jgi:hypothetical protein
MAKAYSYISYRFRPSVAARSGARSNHDWGAHPCTRVSEGGGRRTISGGLVVSVCFPCPPERALRSEWLRSPRPMSGEGLAAQKSSRSAAPAPATKQKKQRIDRAGLDNDELVRLAVELRSCEASGITLHTLWMALRQLRLDISDPGRDSLNSSPHRSRAELASLLCFGEGDCAEEEMLTKLEGSWELVDKARPQHDQLQMRVVQWLWLWVRGYGVTNLERLASLVHATREEDAVARHAPRNAPRKRDKRLKMYDWKDQTEIVEERPGVLAGRPESIPSGGRSQLALLPKAAGGDDEAEKMDEEDTEVETVEEGLLHRSELNKTGYKGVTHMLKMKKFRAMETGPQGKCLGYFDTAKKAAVCYAKHMKSQEGAQEASIRPSPSDDDDDDDGDDNDDDDDDDEEATGDDEDDNDDAGSQPDRCERNPQCTRGYKHGGNGGRCSLPRLLQLSRAVAEAPRRHDASSTSTQTCNRALTPASAPPSPYY